ncbi:coniferyl-alcohol dehydrogenase [Gordonia polyisoprenivorans]|uniref:coniferyl-alcohol dehydrogenase n=1 Tax=Gordonia polyisoprenivorans TaxID=84595 RepID=UPI001AD657CE|nr:coniferyl-alcohol dehydrogenase [Gordonia polyisoprenivorans]QTI68975.1 coniferyl-alcohol dehydrogenase [Gordonia polyisoprenivorans]
MSEFNGKRVVVTGAASGIGHAVAAELVKAGAEVTSLDRNAPTAAVARHIPVDLSDISSIEAALEQLGDGYDALLNIAGVPGTAPAATVFAVNTLATRVLAEEFLTRLNPGGAVVVVSSTAGFGWPNRLEQIRDFLATDTFAEGAAWFEANPQEGNAYNFSKECTTVFVHAMGLVFADAGLRINAVLPGPVETPILQDFRESMGEETIDGVAALLGRHATAEDIAGVVTFLASDASSWMNGSSVTVDGGITGAVLSGSVPAPEI